MTTKVITLGCDVFLCRLLGHRFHVVPFQEWRKTGIMFYCPRCAYREHELMEHFHSDELLRAHGVLDQ